VQARIRELREERIEGMPTIAEFLERRFGPAMDTCKAVWQRHEQAAGRVARAVDLLRTRVNLAQEEDTARLLEGMNQTARSQLRLQHAVEGLSVAAISYYVLSLFAVALKALHAVHLPLDPETVEGILIIPVVLVVLLATRYSRRSERERRVAFTKTTVPNRPAGSPKEFGAGARPLVNSVADQAGMSAVETPPADNRVATRAGREGPPKNEEAWR